MSENLSEHPVSDQPAGELAADEDDTPPTGPRRVLIALYAVFALAATARGIVQIATKFDDAPLAYLLSLFSGVVYIAAAIGLASIIDSSAFPHDTVWSRFGAGYGYVPIILPVLGLMWLWQSRGYDRSRDATG